MSELRREPEDAPIGGVGMPSELRRRLPPLPDVPMSELAKHVTLLLNLHPEVRVNFREVRVADLDEATLQIFLEDLNELLGVH